MATAKSFEQFVIRVLKGKEHRFTDEVSTDDSTISDVVKSAYVHALRHYPVPNNAKQPLIEALLWAGTQPKSEPLLWSECGRTIEALGGKDQIKRAYMSTNDAVQADRFATLWGCTHGGIKNNKLTLPARNMTYIIPGKKGK